MTTTTHPTPTATTQPGDGHWTIRDARDPRDPAELVQTPVTGLINAQARAAARYLTETGQHGDGWWQLDDGTTGHRETWQLFCGYVPTPWLLHRVEAD